MPRCHLTKEFVEELKDTPVTKRTMFLDTELKDLVLEMRPTYKGTWYFRGRDADGKLKMLRLGPIHKMSLYQARASASKFYNCVERGSCYRLQESAWFNSLF